MKKFFRTIRSLWGGFFWGLRSVDDTMMHTETDTLPGSHISQEVNDQRVSKALLKGEVTQEVEELRYRTYKVDREAKQYEYIAPTLAFKREKDNDSKFISYENADNLEIITIQPNECDVVNVTESIKDVDFNKASIINKTSDIEIEIGKFKPKKEYLIKIKRDFYPRYRIEEYTKRLVVKRVDDKRVILDFYVSKYPNISDFKSKGFVREVEKIKDERMKSDILDLGRVSFTTLHAYKLVDMLYFEFKQLKYKEIVEFDGHYIIRFEANVVKNGEDLTDKYYSKTMDEKYQKKVKKDVIIDPFNSIPTVVYKCEHCGKEMYYDPEHMDTVATEKPREIDEEIVEKEDSATEFMDAQITYETYGIVLCKNCLKQYLKENNLI